MRRYLVYRYGSNAANQPRRNYKPIAIVGAASKAGAISAVLSRDQTAIVYHRDLVCYNNQSLRATTRAPLGHWREIDGLPGEHGSRT